MPAIPGRQCNNYEDIDKVKKLFQLEQLLISNSPLYKPLYSL